MENSHDTERSSVRVCLPVEMIAQINIDDLIMLVQSCRGVKLKQWSVILSTVTQNY